MIRSILVPLDGSRFSEQALPTALGLATAAPGSATLHLMHVLEPLVSPAAVAGLPAPEPGFDASLPAEMEAYLRSLADRIRRRWNLDVSVAVTHGRASAAIVAQARAVGADLIVLTTHGRGGLSRFWLGSVADELLRTAEVPVFAVRPARRGPSLDRVQRVRHVLVPLDGTDQSEAVLAAAGTTARVSRARLTLVRVVAPHLAIARPAPVTRIDRQDLARQRADATRYLGGVADRLRREGLKPLTRVVTGADPARAILRAAGTGRADVIAMTTHARGGVARLLRGSVCDKVLRGARAAAVLMTRPHVQDAPASTPELS